MFRVRSKTDVITHSSSEVFIMKVQDWDDFMEYLKGSDLENKEYVETSLTKNVKVYHSKEDIKRIMRPPSGLGLPAAVPPSANLRISTTTLQILVDFGHTVTEVKEYLEKKDKEFWDKVLADPAWNELIGKAYGELDHWNSCVEVIEKWMKKNKRKFIEHYRT